MNENRRRIFISRIVLFYMLVALSGCGVRSISNSGYQADSERGYSRIDSPLYKGELSEFDVLGIDPNDAVTEEDIRQSLKNATDVSLKRGDKVMLVQSGAPIPDEYMVQSINKYFATSMFSGVPQSAQEGGGYARLLRLAAAKAGIRSIVVYWGVLETGRIDLATKAISWVPIVGAAIPDETQKMRIRLKLAVVDVESGSWATFSPTPFEDDDTSASLNRVSSDQGQVNNLKKKAYAAATDELVARFAG